MLHRADVVFVGKNECLQDVAGHIASKLKVKVATTRPRAPGVLHVVTGASAGERWDDL